AREDLQKRAPRQFYVSELFGAHSLPARLKECRGLLQSHRSLFPLHGFNALYSLLCHWQDIAQSAKEDAWDILAECCHFTVVSLAKSLGDVTGDSPGMSSDERCHARNALKMLMFLVTQQLELFEADLGSGKPIPGTKKGRKKKASSAACAEMIRLRWDDEVSGLVEQVKQLCLLQLHMLWEPPVIEEDFVNLIGDLCFRVLDNPSFIRIQEVREPVTSILTRLVRSYNYSRTGAIKLSQLLVMCEQPQPNQVVHLVNGFLAGQQNDMRCFKNTAGTGALCTFLVEFTQLHPDIAEQSLPHFKRYLSNSELDSKQRAKVDRYLDTLEEHVHDLNGFVRSRCLQIWLQIVEAKSLPYERMGRLVELIAGPQGSLLDTSAMARKHSMKILAAMLECNPAVRVPTDQLNADFEREVKILQELEASQDPELVQKELTWRRRIIPKVLQLLSQQVRSAAAASATDAAEAPAAARAADGDDSEGDAAAEDEEEEGIGEEETAEAVARRIYDNFQRNRVSRAIRLFALAHDAFTDNPIFSTRIEEVPNSDSQPASASQAEAQSQKLRVQAWTDRLKDIYMGEAYAANSRQSEACAQIAKQQTLIACLRQSLQFVEQVKSAIPFVVAMLGSSTQSDILEAVAFLLAGHQQGMAECAPGFKKMLGLVWSKEAAIKQAVVSAYEKMYTEVFVDQDAGIGPDEAEKLRVSAIVGSLSQLICSATLGDLLSLEKLVCEFVRSGVIDKPVVQVRLTDSFTDTF
uniref:Cnd1_N domain-containing protein n=1 Tax=Macrostomum lignano TaxID=282301 RepID=A0A1I8FXC9_9PLAT